MEVRVGRNVNERAIYVPSPTPNTNSLFRPIRPQKFRLFYSKMKTMYRWTPVPVRQDAGQRGLFVPFFGRPASTHKAIVLLPMKYGGPLVVVAAIRTGDELRHRRRERQPKVRAKKAA